MALTLTRGFSIVNVELVKIVTNETTARTFYMDTMTTVTCTPSISAGQEVEQRVKNQVLGLLRTEDLVKGYDIEIEDERLEEDILALVDGGTNTEGTGDTWSKYESPVAGAPVNRTEFTLTFYTSDRGTDGNAEGYHSWEFKGCKGSPVTVGAADGSFQKTKYSIKSRPANGQSALTLTPLTALPST